MTGFDFSNAGDYLYMFFGMHNTTIDNIIFGDSLETISPQSNMNKFFEKINSDEVIDLSSWDTSNVTNMTDIFSGIDDTVFNLGYWEMGSVTSLPNDLSGMNIYCHVEGDDTTADTIETTAGTFNCVGYSCSIIFRLEGISDSSTTESD